MLSRNYGFWMKRLTLASGVLFLLLSEYSAVFCSYSWVTWQWLHLSSIYYCVLIPWSRTRDMCQSWWFLDLVALFYCAGRGCLGPVERLICSRWLGYFVKQNLSMAVAKCWYFGSVVPVKTSICLVMVLQLSTLQLYLVVISWSLAKHMHVEKLLTSWWLMFLT